MAFSRLVPPRSVDRRRIFSRTLTGRCPMRRLPVKAAKTILAVRNRDTRYARMFNHYVHEWLIGNWDSDFDSATQKAKAGQHYLYPAA